VQWTPRRTESAALVLIGLGLGLAAAVVVADAPGRILVGAAAFLVLALALRDLLAGPRLSAGPDGVVVRTLWTRRSVPWPLLRVQVRVTRRFGVASRALELDTAAGPDDDGVLVLLTRRDLGAEPEVVATALRGLRPDACDPTRGLEE
jgi:hypothetical protein